MGALQGKESVGRINVDEIYITHTGGTPALGGARPVGVMPGGAGGPVFASGCIKFLLLTARQSKSGEWRLCIYEGLLSNNVGSP
jgi:hypothetical protein